MKDELVSVVHEVQHTNETKRAAHHVPLVKGGVIDN